MPKQWQRQYDFSGGLNTKDASHLIADNELQDARNCTFEEQGKIATRKGMSLYEEVTVSTSTEIDDMDTDPVAWTNATRDTTTKQEGTASVRTETDVRSIVVSDFDDTAGWEGTWTGGSGTAAYDTTEKYQGSGSLLLSDPATYSAGYWNAVADASRTFSSAKNYSSTYISDSTYLNFYIQDAYAADPSKVSSSSSTLWLYTSSSNYYYVFCSIPTSSSTSDRTWRKYSFLKSAFTSVGSPSWSNLTSAVVRYSLISTVDNGTMECRFDMAYWDAAVVAAATPVLTFGSAQNYSAIATTTAFRSYVYTPYWKSGATHGGITLSAADVTHHLCTDDSNYYSTATSTYNTGTTWDAYTLTKSAFTETGTGNWASITKAKINATLSISVSDATAFSNSATNYVACNNYDQWSWLQSSSGSGSVIRATYVFNKSDGNNHYYCAIDNGTNQEIRTWSDVDLSTGTYTTGLWWTFTVLNDICVATNGTDAVQKLVDSATAAAALGGSPSTGKYCCTHENRVFIAGNSTDPSDLYFSEIADPETWLAENYLEVHTDDDQIITGILPFKGNLLVFKTNSIWKLVAEGLPENWYLYNVCDFGCVAPRSIAIGDAGIFYLSSDGVRVYDNTDSIIISDKISDLIRDRVDWSKTSEMVAEIYDGLYRLWVVDDDGSESYATLAFVFDTKRATWTIWETGQKITSLCYDKLNTNVLYAGTDLANIVKCDDGYSDLGAAIETYAITKDFNLGVPEKDKKFKRLYVQADTVAMPGYNLGVDYYIDFSSTANNTEIALGDAENDLKVERMSVGARGKYIRLKFSHDAVNEPITVYGFTNGYRPKKLR